MNLQGDEPLINIEDIKSLHLQMKKTNSELGTLTAKIKDKDIFVKQNIVKVVTGESLDNSQFPEAINFYRHFIRLFFFIDSFLQNYGGLYT